MDDEERSQRLREYKRSWVAKRRADYMRGKRCVDCGGRDQLEIDHIVPAEKIDHRVWSWSAERRAAELSKCTVRCKPCHQRKTARDVQPCGTDAAYKRGCRCVECRGAHAALARKHRAGSTRGPRQGTYTPRTNAAKWVAEAVAHRSLQGSGKSS